MELVNNESKIEPQIEQEHVLFYPIPCNLDIRKIILAESVKGARCESEPEKQADKAIYILGMISVVRFRNWDEYENELSFVRLSSKVLKKYVKEYNKYLQYFLEKEIIEVNDSYQADRYCKGYRFSEKYRDQYIKSEKIKDLVLCARISKMDQQTGIIRVLSSNTNMVEDDRNRIIGYPILTQTLKNITIDIQGAVKEVLQEVKNQELNNAKANKQFYYFTSVYFQDFYITQDKFGGRIHSTITSFPKKYRKYLKHPGVSNWGKIDISNCQVYLLGCLLYENTLSTYLFMNYTNHTIPIMWPAYDKLPNDTKEFVAKSCKGVIYDDLLERMWRMKGKRYTKNQIKAKTLGLLFEPVHWESAFKELFQNVYPNVFNFIEEINGQFRVTKKLSKKYGRKKYDKNKMAFLLQRAESYIILDQVVKEISNIDEEIPVLTIHDELMVPEEKMDLVIEIMKNEFLRLTNSVPRFKCEVIQAPACVRAA